MYPNSDNKSTVTPTSHPAARHAATHTRDVRATVLGDGPNPKRLEATASASARRRGASTANKIRTMHACTGFFPRRFPIPTGEG